MKIPTLTKISHFNKVINLRETGHIKECRKIKIVCQIQWYWCLFIRFWVCRMQTLDSFSFRFPINDRNKKWPPTSTLVQKRKETLFNFKLFKKYRSYSVKIWNIYSWVHLWPGLNTTCYLAVWSVFNLFLSKNMLFIFCYFWMKIIWFKFTK